VRKRKNEREREKRGESEEEKKGERGGVDIRFHFISLDNLHALHLRRR